MKYKGSFVILVLMLCASQNFAAENLFEIDRKFNAGVSLFSDLDKWLSNVDGVSLDVRDNYVTYSVNIQYYTKQGFWDVHPRPYFHEEKDSKKAFKHLCKKHGGIDVTAVEYVDKRYRFPYKKYYQFFRSRYQASSIRKPFYEACEVNGQHVIFQFGYYKVDNIFWVKVIDNESYMANRKADFEGWQKAMASARKQKMEEELKEKARIRKMEENYQKKVALDRVKRAAGFRRSLEVGDMTSIGMVVDIRKPIAKIQLQSNGDERWYKIDELYPE
ncbi:hypothetical protein ACJJI4_07785 [Microbulbifer sp. TRSA002]|uniref:hypothetical protein n=1 Tax=Microbulbifer sp. TRSA002 TaxID=3243382 RepID=UPI004039C9B5